MLNALFAHGGSVSSVTLSQYGVTVFKRETAGLMGAILNATNCAGANTPLQVDPLRERARLGV